MELTLTRISTGFYDFYQTNFHFYWRWKLVWEFSIIFTFFPKKKQIVTIDTMTPKRKLFKIRTVKNFLRSPLTMRAWWLLSDINSSCFLNISKVFWLLSIKFSYFKKVSAKEIMSFFKIHM